MLSQHRDSITLYHKLKDRPIQCDQTLGVTVLKRLKGASPGVGGATLLTAYMDGNPVVIKVFPNDCPVKYLRGAVRGAAVRDYGDYEPGTGLMLTEQLILPGLTQNITTCYNQTVCDPAYDTVVSLCTRQSLIPKPSYPMPNVSRCQENDHPLCIMDSVYRSVSTQGHFEVPPRSDAVRFMMVEKCAGDIQGLIELFGDKRHESIETFDHSLYKMLFMTFHALILLDCIFDGYSHKDLGARNVLYTFDPHQRPRTTSCLTNTYYRYLLPSGDNFITVDISSNTLIPKIWDFAFVRYGNAAQYQDYYKHLGTTPTLASIVGEGRENDVYVLLNDIDRLMRTNGITDSMFNTLNLESVQRARNNTGAVYSFFALCPLSEDLLGNKDHIVVHTFPANLTVFNHLNLERSI